jgi:hypothetical protein
MMHDENEMTEGEYLDSIYDDEDFAETEDGGFVIFPNRAREEAQALMFGGNRRFVSEAEREADRQQSFKEKRDLYEVAKAAKVGSMIACPNCKKMHKKTTYHKIFCSNQRTKPGRRNCKDRYWNTTDEVRRERAGQYCND